MLGHGVVEADGALDAHCRSIFAVVAGAARTAHAHAGVLLKIATAALLALGSGWCAGREVALQAVHALRLAVGLKLPCGAVCALRAGEAARDLSVRTHLAEGPPAHGPVLAPRAADAVGRGRRAGVLEVKAGAARLAHGDPAIVVVESGVA